MRVVAALAAILLSGCATPASSPIVEVPIGAVPPCARVRVTAEPPEIALRETAWIYVVVENCGTSALTFHASETCTRYGFHARLQRGPETWHLWRGESARRDAPQPGTCAVVPTSTWIEPGRSLVESFAWNGTEVQPGSEDGRLIAMPAGDYGVEVPVDLDELPTPTVGRSNVTLRAS
jgi:hypothetical protein